MAKNLNPAKIAKLVAVQRVKQAGAEADLAIARDSEQRADAEAQAARARLASGQDLWFEYLARPAFVPEFASAIADQLVAVAASEKDASERHRLAIDLSGRRLQDWQLADARVRATGKKLREAERGASLRYEERRLSEFADRLTYGWITR